MGAILKQLVGCEDILEDLREAFQRGSRKYGIRGPLLRDLIRVLTIAIASLPQLFIYIKALSECLPRNLPDLLESLSDLVRESPKTRIFFTARHVSGELFKDTWLQS